MEPTQTRQSCFARMLDVRSYVIAARHSMLNADNSVALFMIAAFGLIGLVLAPIWVSFDLMSTWDFTTSLRNASEAVVETMASRTDTFLNLSVGALIAGLIWTGFTLLPSLFELAFPTVSHPLLSLLLLCSIVFDYVTDWVKAAEVTANWTDNPALAFVYTIFFCAFVSVGVQAVLVLCITIVIFGFVALLRGGARQAQVIIER
jgi:hypothetical protein